MCFGHSPPAPLAKTQDKKSILSILGKHFLSENKRKNIHQLTARYPVRAWLTPNAHPNFHSTAFRENFGYRRRYTKSFARPCGAGSLFCVTCRASVAVPLVARPPLAGSRLRVTAPMRNAPRLLREAGPLRMRRGTLYVIAKSKNVTHFQYYLVI